jgi:hypothetical protein
MKYSYHWSGKWRELYDRNCAQYVRDHRGDEFKFRYRLLDCEERCVAHQLGRREREYRRVACLRELRQPHPDQCADACHYLRSIRKCDRDQFRWRERAGVGSQRRIHARLLYLAEQPGHSDTHRFYVGGGERDFSWHHHCSSKTWRDDYSLEHRLWTHRRPAFLRGSPFLHRYRTTPSQSHPCKSTASLSPERQRSCLDSLGCTNWLSRSQHRCRTETTR